MKLHSLSKNIIIGPYIGGGGELFEVQGIQLHLSSAYLPQIDWQTKVTNKTLERYLY